MSQQTICDDCGEPIEVGMTYYTIQLGRVDLGQGVMGTYITQDFHEEHLPEGLTPAPTPEQIPSEGDDGGA